MRRNNRLDNARRAMLTAEAAKPAPSSDTEQVAFAYVTDDGVTGYFGTVYGATVVIRKRDAEPGTIADKYPWIVTVRKDGEERIITAYATPAQGIQTVQRGIHTDAIARAWAQLQLPPVQRGSLLDQQIQAGQVLQNAQVARGNAWSEMAYRTVYGTAERHESLKNYALLLDAEREALAAYLEAIEADAAKYGYLTADEVTGKNR
jgi:hypothetical protein